MKRQIKDIIKENIYANNTGFSENVEITHSLRKESLIRLVLSLAFFTFIMVFNEKITKLSIITSDTILNHHVFFKADVLFFFILAFALFINLLSFISTFITKKHLHDIKTKVYYLVYRIYDFVSFACSLIIIIDFIILFLITPVTVSGNSMNNTLKDGDKCLIWHFMYEPDNDDIIILDAKKYSGEEKFFVKRIVAKEEDRIKLIRMGSSYYFWVNDEIVERNFTLDAWKNITGQVVDPSNKIVNLEFIIPNDKYVIMGDNRGLYQSYDSRNFGLVDKCDIIGRLVLRYYPFNSFGSPQKNLFEVL